MEVLYFVPRRLNKSRIQLLTRLAANHNLFKVAQNYRESTILVAQDSTENEILSFISKHEKQKKEDILKNRKLVDISWFSKCIKEEKFIEINSKYTLKTEKEGVSEEPPTKKFCTEKTVAESDLKYACQRKTPLNHPNKILTDALEVLEQHALYRGDINAEARALSFRRGSSSIKACTHKINSEGDLKGIRYVDLNSTKSGHCKKVILDILNTGQSYEVEEVINGEFYKTMNLFCGIFGVGPQTARKLYFDKEMRTLDDIGKENISLTTDQTLGLEHYTDLNTPVKIEEAKHVLKLVQETCTLLREGLQVTLVGGFRRGKTEGHDIDLLITHTVEGMEKGVLPLLLEHLKDHFIYTGRRMSSSKHQSLNKTSTSTMDEFEKCFSIFKFQKSWLSDKCSNEDKNWKAVRVDLIMVPIKQLPFALLGWTGTKHFEREIRRYAKAEKRMVLTSNGIYSADRAQSFPASSEEDIFKLLGLKFIEPSDRCC